MKISRAEFARRRKHLMSMMDSNSIAIIPAAREVTRSRDTEFVFRQDSDFLYLTGFDEPDAVLALLPGRRQGQVVMFCRDRDPTMELWNGYRAGPKGVVERYGMDDAFPIDDIDEILPGLIEGRGHIYYSMGHNDAFDRRVMRWVNRLRRQSRTGAKPPGEFTDLGFLLHEQRLIKSAAELRLMKKAGDISAGAHARAMRECRPDRFEYQLEAAILHEFAENGARSAAYTSIVGGGANACVLHYVENRDKLRDGDLVLIDAGCEYQGYAADITRTFPVNGRFSLEQRAIYDLVFKAQLAAIRKIAPGGHWNQPHDATVRVITRGLIELGLLKGKEKDLIKSGAYRDFYMHRAGHWLGMDVHDVGDYRIDGKWRQLEPGMVMTVEPGIYIAPNNRKVPKKWRGIGVRIEDDVVVTESGCDILTANVPKDAEAIEALMAGS
ncbi:aminopeptidase P II [Luminiphilus syltensis NOR5-1B]|uniref:Xaa-Pro aminopeptidase n=1 Tax=Luminiphilus syltensis NOR5-1B TaxID=565045 RepID=B8KU49_9GAMM|nr:Xaa-Pro aminopeptidase [Luminiphilus syltensis]EED34676.1 aminopeptidase P II [Luminiphilus syltensis NOR5-1B]